MNLPRALNLLLLAMLLGGSVAAYPDLPQRIPTHVGFSGEADAWARTSLLRWLLPVGIAVATLGLVYVCAALLPRFPHLLNIPDKQRFLALPPERQAPVIALSRRFLEWVGVSVMVTFALVQVHMYRIATGQDDGPALLLATLLVGPVVLVAAGLYVGRVQRLIREAE